MCPLRHRPEPPPSPLPPPPAHITTIMLSNALEARAIRETLRNEAIRKAVHDIDGWRETQRNAIIDNLVSDMVSKETDLESLARSLDKLDPRIASWVTSIRPQLKETLLKMVAEEPTEDHAVPMAEEILHNAWIKKKAEIDAAIHTRTTELVAQLNEEADAFLTARKFALEEDARAKLTTFETELNDRVADERQQLKNKYKATIQLAREEEESRVLSLAVRTPKATKPSPLNVTRPKKPKKKKVTILDLTTPPPGNEASDTHTDMETDADSTPTTPICRSSAPSPAPLPTIAPDTVTTQVADPESIPRWAQTPSPDEKTPHASSFPVTNPAPHTPSFPTPAPAPTAPSNDLSTIMAAITGMKSELMSRIEQVNARIDQTTGPADIPGYMAWEHENLAAFETPGYIDPAHDTMMETLEAANTAREIERLDQERVYRTLLHRYVAEGHLHDITDDAYTDKWYEVCRGIYTSMSWSHEDQLTADQDDTILNAWRRAEVSLDEAGWDMSTTFIFERLTGKKPNTSTDEGRKTFNNFSTTYNRFCAEHNFNPSDGFEEIHDPFFRLFAKTLQTPSTPTPPQAQAPKAVRFTSIPPIATLPNPPSSSPEDFPRLQAPTKAPISYASATSAFIPVTHRRRNKPEAPKPTASTTTTPANKQTQSGSKLNPKSLCPQKPPLPDALKMTKHTIILDHVNPDTRSKYSLDAGELTRGLQKHLEAVKALLVLLAGAWSIAPFYKNFILTFSGIVNYTDITKFDSILFGPFGKNCRAALTTGYQSILISGVRLQRDATGKLASPKMLFDELCSNTVFVGHLPLAAPCWLFNLDKLLASGKLASSITFAFHDPTGEGLELMKCSHVGMFGKLITI